MSAATTLGHPPYDLLLAALGACKSMTLRMYAERKNWPLDQARITLRHEKIHAEDCDNCHSKTGYVDRVNTEVHITGDLSDEQRQRLFEIADRCPVHQTLTHEVNIVSTLK